MRKFVIPLLVASVALPGIANAQWRNMGHDDGAPAARAERDKEDSRPQRTERPQQVERQQVERPRFDPPQRPQVQVQRPDNQNVERANRSLIDAMRAQVQRQQVERQQGDGEARQQQIDATREQMRQRRFEGRPNADRQDRAVPDSQRRGWDGYRDRVITQGQVIPQDRDRDRDGDRDGRRWRGNTVPQQWANRDGSWSNRWRHDNRYDWRRYRDHNRSTFRIGIYYDPYGYNYRRYNIGWNLWPSYYQSNYWIDDPWMYRLPQVWGPYRWVRYYNDALLVNIYTGQVEDVLYNFFW